MRTVLRRSIQRLAGLVSRAGAGRPWLVATLVVTLAVALWFVAVSAAWFTLDVTLRLPSPAQLADIGNMAQSTAIYDVRNRQVFTIFKEQRIDVPLARVSPNLVKAVVSVEDQRFFAHGGVDVVRTVAAAVANVRSGRRAQGGSTITQQLARQSFLSRDKTLRRKVKEALLAAQIEHSFSKQEILTLYLNKVYFGDGLYGIEAASRGFLGKHASELSVPDAALLAGLIQSPSTYAPTINLEKATARRNVVLRTMLDSGAIDRAAYEVAREAPVTLEDSLRREESFGLYVKEQIRRELVERFGWERVSEGGLRVHATIDADLQRQTEQALDESLERLEERSGYSHPTRESMLPIRKNVSPDYIQGAAVVLDASTGEVRAMVGGRNFAESRFNRAVQAKRQPGSAFKPFVFATALEHGFTPATLLTGLDDPVLTPQGAWVPEDEHSGAEAMTLRTALRTSSNRAAVRLLTSVGIERTVAQARLMEVGSVPSVPSLALGAGEVTLLSMTAAYASFANGGVVHGPALIRKVEAQDGTVIYEARPSGRRVVSEATAYQMASMLQDVINAGTAYRARQTGFTLPAAGKTGTTNDYFDAWFVGFTPRVVTGVWIGFDAPKTIIANGYAGDVAVPLWARVMKAATRGHPAAWLTRPRDVVGVEICRMSGRRPNDGCDEVEVVRDSGEVETRSMIHWEYFVRGTQPSEVCPLHPGINWAERLASAFGKDVGPEPVTPTEAGLPAEPSADTAQAAPKKKRGFWSRLFGRGDDDRDKKDDREKDPPRNP